MATAFRTTVAVNDRRIPNSMWALAIKKTRLKEKTRLYPDGSHEFEGMIFAVAAGMVVETETFDHTNKFVEIHGPGDFFAWQNLYGHAKRTTKAIAMANTEIVHWSAEKIEDTITSNSAMESQFAREFLKLATRQRAMMRAMTALKRNDNKLAWHLLDLADRLGAEHDGLITFIHPGHTGLSGLIGTSREHITLIMSTFRKQRIINYDRKKIMILNVEALTEMASFEPVESEESE